MKTSGVSLIAEARPMSTPRQRGGNTRMSIRIAAAISSEI